MSRKFLNGVELGVPASVLGQAILNNAVSSRQVILDSLNPTGTGNATLHLPQIAGGSADVLVANNNPATLTNKTLTSPTINGGAITGITDLTVADGGTGASDATTARTNLGVGRALLASGTVTNAATLDLVLTSYTAYRGIEFVLSGFQPATDGVVLWMRLSTNGGSSYDAGAGNYKWRSQFDALDGSNGALGSTSDTEIELSASIGNASAEHYDGRIELFSQTSTAFNPLVSFSGVYIDIAGNGVRVAGGGQRMAAQDTDAARFLFSSGNISAGKYAVYGLL